MPTYWYLINDWSISYMLFHSYRALPSVIYPWPLFKNTELSHFSLHVDFLKKKNVDLCKLKTCDNFSGILNEGSFFVSWFIVAYTKIMIWNNYWHSPYASMKGWWSCQPFTSYLDMYISFGCESFEHFLICSGSMNYDEMPMASVFKKTDKPGILP